MGKVGRHMREATPISRLKTVAVITTGAGLLLSCGPSAGVESRADTTGDWPNYANDPGGSKYSPLSEINTKNVADLQLAWTARAGDFPPELLTEGGAAHTAEAGPGVDPRSVGQCATCHGSEVKFEVTPLMRDGRLLLSTPLNRVLALDPGSGEELWSFDPELDPEMHSSEGLISRGVSAWDDPSGAGDTCASRVYLATIDARLISLDAATGDLCGDFGSDGTVDLSQDVGVNGREVEVGDYLMTSPPAVLGETVVVGSAIGDNRRRDVESGVVRAYDARSGELRWSFDPIPRSDDHPGASEWSDEARRTTGAANVWSIISADPERDMVFLPTGSAAPDFYGGDRLGRNDLANSVVALRGSTGEFVWSFQVVHHDVWDYDVPAQPVLIELERDGSAIPAVVIGTKMGHIFVVHRETGEPLFPVEERPVPQSTVPGEQTWPTQPFPTFPQPLHTTEISPDDAFGINDSEREFCRNWIASLDNQGAFTPPSLRGIVQWPGFAGGMNWGGMGWDPERQMIVTTIKRVAMFVQLHPRADFDSGLRVEGREYTGQGGTAYGMSRQLLVSPLGLPCSPPPWGQLVGVSLRDGTVSWKLPLGTIPGLDEVRAARSGDPWHSGAPS